MSTNPKKPVWQFTRPQDINVAKFIDRVNEKRNFQTKTYYDLYRWSVGSSTLQDFWADAYTFLELTPREQKRAGKVLACEASIIAHTPYFSPIVLQIASNFGVPSS
jgi:acetoacetyl-CoA synthetase